MKKIVCKNQGINQTLAEFESLINVCISHFNKKSFNQIFNEIFEESRKEIVIETSLRRTEIGKDYNLDIAKDKMEIQLRKKFFNDCPDGFEVDHIFPRSKGGSDDLSNLQWLPKALNTAKRDNLYCEGFFYPHCMVEIQSNILHVKNERIKNKIVAQLAQQHELDKNSIIFLYETLLKFGNLSITYIMRKLKCDCSTAKSVLENIKLNPT